MPFTVRPVSLVQPCSRHADLTGPNGQAVGALVARIGRETTFQPHLSLQAGDCAARNANHSCGGTFIRPMQDEPLPVQYAAPNEPMGP